MSLEIHFNKSVDQTRNMLTLVKIMFGYKIVDKFLPRHTTFILIFAVCSHLWNI